MDHIINNNKKRFLITTADERTWKTDRPVVFLGEWCRIRDRRDCWLNLDAVVVPPYGHNEGQRYEDYQYTWRLYEQLLLELADALNQYHKEQRSIRYWRIILGPWLYKITTIIFNRWATVQLALRDYKINGTTIIDVPQEQTIPRDMNDFDIRISDLWNHSLFARIITDWTKIPFAHVPLGSTHSSELIVTPSAKAPKSIVSGLKSWMVGKVFSNAFFSRSSDAFIISSYMPPQAELRLQLALRQVPKIWRRYPAPQVAPDLNKRRGLTLVRNEHQGFDRCIRTLIPEQIPSIYLEGYQKLRQAVGNLPWPKRPKVIFTSNNFEADEIFKAWTAEKTEQGIPYVIGQHGANYGSEAFNYSEWHEVPSADRFLTWGWSEDNPKYYPSVALRLVGLPPGQWDPFGSLLLVTNHGGRYAGDPWDANSLFIVYLEEQFRFAAALPDNIRSELIVRLHPSNFSDTHGDPKDILPWQHRHPDVRIDDGTGPFAPLVQRSRIYVATYNATYLETLCLDIPTVIFWNPVIDVLRPAAIPYFERLKQIGIFHESPESAAAKIAEVWHDVAGWWRQPEIQEARRYFCDHFARMPKEPIKVLVDALTTVKNSQTG